MKKKTIPREYLLRFSAIPGVLSFLFLFCFTTSAQAMEDLAKMVHGGKLYDNWLSFVPEQRRQLLKKVRLTHPSYPADAKKKGLTTWRCKECHGWDYRGREIVVHEGNAKVAIKGIQRLAGADPREVITIIRNQTHRYDQTMITDRDAEALAFFVVNGQRDLRAVIDPVTGKTKGDDGKGAPFFQTICAVCHGLDGRKIDMDPKEGVEYPAHIAREDPYEFLHKIHFGQPGQIMVSMSALTFQQQIDILAYVQTLPVTPREATSESLPFEPGPKEFLPFEDEDSLD
ncbi:MAG TPA: hypothetical protein HPQ00_05885 [Magnetococcales bacterium]|nr:hypothetical protein [Magnetococcales bacterium]